MIICSNLQMFKSSNVQFFKWSYVHMFKCSNVQMFKCSNVQMFKYSNVKYQMSNFKCQMLKFCRSVPPEFLRSFFVLSCYNGQLVPFVLLSKGRGDKKTNYIVFRILPWKVQVQWVLSCNTFYQLLSIWAQPRLPMSNVPRLLAIVRGPIDTILTCML